MRSRRTAAVAAITALALGITMFGWPAAAGAAPTRIYRVRVINLTDGQPLTPPIIATAKGSWNLFRVGDLASVGVQQVAENGNGAPLLGGLEQSPFVFSSLESDEGPLVPPETPMFGTFSDRVSLQIEATARTRFLSVISMLICTNDGFTGVSRLPMPNGIGHEITIFTNGYDAGTEVNTEDYADLVPPCQALIGHDAGEGDAGTGTTNPALAENGVIHHHQGIQGTDDLEPSIHGWQDPVARITVRRVA
jgi:Spondin_N